MTSQPDRLPRTPSELLELALNDCLNLDRTAYTPEAFYYHMPKGHGHCSICLAGSMMANTFKLPLTQKATPADLFMQGSISYSDAECLMAVNLARIGSWQPAFKRLSIDPATVRGFSNMMKTLEALPNLHRDFTGWLGLDSHLDYIRRSITILKAHGA